MTRPLIDAKRARALFAYDKASGVLRWKVRRHNNIPAGGRAGCVKTGNAGKQSRQVCVDSRCYAEHRLIFLIVKGRWPKPGFEIDHRDGDACNNRWLNLREATRAQNKWNIAAQPGNQSGLKGVRSMPSGRFQASIIAHLGTFKTAEAAHAAYRKAARLLHGDFANTKRHPKPNQAARGM